ncbi:hypothetical protein [[Mannheimia] succiniciproducens]|uniref:hypothetical protein n=1 Tax=[Mannheimia] succiniciproducens TaxID=157673 RepID=UPI0012FEAB68|nr:hypothetical protein [[Mannheimia] succiniciproducens]
MVVMVLLKGVLSGTGTYIGGKVSNPAWSSVISEIIQKTPIIIKKALDKDVE